MSYPHFDGELGAIYTPEATTFRLWAPTAQEVILQLAGKKYPLVKGGEGQWETSVEGDMHLAEYTYQLTFSDGRTTTAVDPYARSVTANGRCGVVIGIDRVIGPAERMPSFGPPTDAIIYEAHVRDLTISANNGISNKGKFLGLTEPGTRTDKGNLSGLDYLANLGCTHVQLLPVYDFGSVDETGDLSFDAQYNWGYDPVNYNAPEGSYSTDPSDPAARIREFKALVDALHSRGLRVVMDVVYNHVYDAASHCFENTVPGYFFRTDSRGRLHNATGCGNETASEKSMMRKFIVDSVVYWATTFGLDGFRFDLMGIHDVETMNAVRQALDAIDPGIVVIGEGWEMGNHPGGVQGAHQGNAALMPGIAMFNDYYRDSLKGDNFLLSNPGFVSGSKSLDANRLHNAMNPPNPSQSVIYNEAHDNWTMFDKLRGTKGLRRATIAEISKRHTLATFTQYFTPGILFLHAGQEFLRTKKGEENSYNSPDSINAFDYDRAQRFDYEVALVGNLNVLRKKYPWTREAGWPREVVFAQGQRLSFRVQNAFGPNRHALVLINGDKSHWAHPVEAGNYRVHVNNRTVFHDPETIRLDFEFVVAPLEATVLEYLG
ncbi:hypothetical protein CPHO_10610 [Corynebacterium phocae]|uniref:Glycosyl hydrolase family 13 catalytic domain-containing protein n=1 Tax=Corynebacterium phocae TaxID=161895 RepID=A0A1L7D577_9CORY|nr:type I pullulanase [Corynebacterium phocae]APT93270.1 hypothetical protein CPHO_10610 [Corynebacterium phocae]KAA8721592.1 type I pullulanase [Corynebacterium phocae]